MLPNSEGQGTHTGISIHMCMARGCTSGGKLPHGGKSGNTGQFPAMKSFSGNHEHYFIYLKTHCVDGGLSSTFYYLSPEDTIRMEWIQWTLADPLLGLELQAKWLREHNIAQLLSLVKKQTLKCLSTSSDVPDINIFK